VAATVRRSASGDRGARWRLSNRPTGSPRRLPAASGSPLAMAPCSPMTILVTYSRRPGGGARSLAVLMAMILPAVVPFPRPGRRMSVSRFVVAVRSLLGAVRRSEGAGLLMALFVSSTSVSGRSVMDELRPEGQIKRGRAGPLHTPRVLLYPSGKIGLWRLRSTDSSHRTAGGLNPLERDSRSNGRSSSPSQVLVPVATRRGLDRSRLSSSGMFAQHRPPVTSPCMRTPA
jgi:hypothetical protein